MNTLSKRLLYQERVNSSIQSLIKHFGEEVGLKCYYMRMAKTQAQIMSLMQLYGKCNDTEEKILVPTDVAVFFSDCCCLFKFLEPFDNLAEEGSDELTAPGKALSKFEKNADYQERVNKAANAIMKHFADEKGLKIYYSEMAKAQAQIVSLIRLCQKIDTCEEDVLIPRDVAIFFYDVCVLYGELESIDDFSRKNIK